MLNHLGIFVLLASLAVPAGGPEARGGRVLTELFSGCLALDFAPGGDRELRQTAKLVERRVFLSSEELATESGRSRSYVMRPAPRVRASVFQFQSWMPIRSDSGATLIWSSGLEGLLIELAGPVTASNTRPLRGTARVLSDVSRESGGPVLAVTARIVPCD